jgi:DNA (cytosine-5)-methyltransferase 1
MRSDQRKLTCIDLFAGCGGLSLGLEQAGFTPLFVNELNDDARESCLINREERFPLLRSRFHNADIKDLVLSEAVRSDLKAGLKKFYGIDTCKKELDLLTGGPPCQGYSGIGYRRSYSVDRKQLPSNHLYQDMAFMVRDLRPKIFLFENVRGLLAARWTKEGEKGEIWNDVYGTFRGLEEYTVRYKVVRANDYGVPQNRPRILLVGLRKDVCFRGVDFGAEDAVLAGFLPKPSGVPVGIEDLLGDLVDPEYRNGGVTISYPSKALTSVQKEMRIDLRTGRIKGKGATLTEHGYSNHSPHVIERFQQMIVNGGVIPEHLMTKKFAQRLLPRCWSDEGATITIASLPDDYVHFSQPRSLTVREWARLQLFPDWYKFAGKRTTGGVRRAGNPRMGLHDREVPKYTQIGNAVPVGLAAAVGRHFRFMLEQL